MDRTRWWWGRNWLRVCGLQSHGRVHTGGEEPSPVPWRLALTLTWPVVEQLGDDGRLGASPPSGGWVAHCSPSVFQFLLASPSLELKITKDGSARTHCPSLPWSQNSAASSRRGLQESRLRSQQLKEPSLPAPLRTSTDLTFPNLG